MDLYTYFYLYPAYAVAIFGWIIYNKKTYTVLNVSSVSENESIFFTNSWLEFIFAIIVGIITILIGQLYLKELLLPKMGNYTFITESINQLLIFSPFFFLLLLRRQPFETSWIQKTDKLKSVFVGFILAIIALLIFLLLKGETNILDNILYIYSYKNLPLLVQVFLEDFAISISLFRLIAWIGSKKAIIIIAFLFAIAHVPAMISNGVATENFANLIFDTLLAIFALKAIYLSKNFLWFWMIHFAMDMTQFIN